VFEAKLNRQTIRRTIGDVRAWNIDAARNEANRLRVTLDGGGDPRAIERQQVADKAAKTAASIADAVTVAEAWAVYLNERQPHWGERHYQDHLTLSKAGGKPAARGTRGRGVTLAGPIYPLLALPLRDLDTATIDAWAAREAKTRPTPARLALRQLKAFLRWCATEPAYKANANANAASGRKTREVLGKAGVKQDALLKEQLSVWFAAVQALPNPVVSAYLQTLLLTGARPGEVLLMKWADINSKWRGLTIRDKVEGERTIPLTPFVHRLLMALPKRSEWVFSSTSSADGVLTIPRNHHVSACKVAGIDNLTLHGLRRSFKSLTEWLEVPAGVVAQIMGHKPSATAEKHYTVRPLDLLRVHHEKIEAWILEQGMVGYEAATLRGKLYAVTG
jgi:integrase